MPYVVGRLTSNGYRSARIEFLVDSGCHTSLVPWKFLNRTHGAVLKTLGKPKDSGIKDANGKPLVGQRLEASIEIEVDQEGTGNPDPMRIPRIDIVALVGDFTFATLGQAGFFERLGVSFANCGVAMHKQFFIYGPACQAAPHPH